MARKYDYLIIGAGIIGLAVARRLKELRPASRILIVEKESQEALHASGRNSGVLHAGFYYTADSFKARFTVAGNRALKEYCRQKGLPINECGKLVVAKDEGELEGLYELERRGTKNGSRVELIDESKALEIEPNVRTFRKALYSPETASVDPQKVCAALKADLLAAGVELSFGTRYNGPARQSCAPAENVIHTCRGDWGAGHIINCGGLYADKIAHDFGFGKNYAILPFKGLYLKYAKNTTDVRTHIYPVPNLKNPFLGVHFTKTVTGEIKIGPTAIPAFWRENYRGWAHFRWDEVREITGWETRLLAVNAFGFRDLAFEEMRKYNKKYFVSLAQRMVRSIDPEGFREYARPGIRAQLLDVRTMRLVQDFLVEGDQGSTHILNAVSPAFTCAFPFAAYVVENHILAERPIQSFPVEGMPGLTGQAP